jgi:rhamnose utilization protein RhaD (predicted bifunctional aldolase and dehydrogenase)
MSDAEQIAEAKACTRRARRAALEAQIWLAIVQDKITVLETAEARRQRVLVQTAVEQMVKAGALQPDDHAGQFRMTEQFIKDPSVLIPLALTKRIYRAGSARFRLEAGHPKRRPFRP